MNITQEQMEAAMASMGNEIPSMEDPMIDVIKLITQDDVIRNVVKVQGGELRCIVTCNSEIKPTTIVDGVTTQIYNPEEDIIAWISIVNNTRSILKQDKDGIAQAPLEAFGPMFGDKTGYALSYLSSFNGDNNILLDDDKVAAFEGASVYAEGVMGTSHDGLKTLITSMCTNSPNYKETCQTWDDATVYDVEVDDCNIEWGCTAETVEEYTKFVSKYFVLWAQPVVVNAEGVEVKEEILQVVTRQVNPDSVPVLGPDSKAHFMVNEIINSQIVAYAEITENTLGGKLEGIKLFKSPGFDISKASF